MAAGARRQRLLAGDGDMPPSRRSGARVSARRVASLCALCFLLGVAVVNSFWRERDDENSADDPLTSGHGGGGISKRSHCQSKDNRYGGGRALDSQASVPPDAIMSLDGRISELEMRLAAARAAQALAKNNSILNSSNGQPMGGGKLFFVLGIISSPGRRRRRNSIRETWLPKGETLRRLEKEMGVVIRFVVGHSGNPERNLDNAIDAEDEQYRDILRLNHTEDANDFSLKIQIYFSTALAMWDADFYVKANDNVHVNIGSIGSILARQRSNQHAMYIGCMKSGPVITKQGAKYQEPEHWKFGADGNNYFRHATGQLYAVSRDVAIYIVVNQHILHKYANEDVSLGSWLIGLNVEYVDERSLCCGTPPDCEWTLQGGNPCGASFDWSCNGICRSVERMVEVHQRCTEGADAIWLMNTSALL